MAAAVVAAAAATAAAAAAVRVLAADVWGGDPGLPDPVYLLVVILGLGSDPGDGHVLGSLANTSNSTNRMQYSQ